MFPPPPSPAPDPRDAREGTAPVARWRSAARFVAWSALLVGVAGLLQLLTPNPWDADTGYHVAVARLIREHGLLRSFPWTPFSWLADHWADKELLFHLLLVPFADLSYVAAARVAGTLCGGLVLVAVYAVVRAEGVERAELWSLLPVVASGGFVQRLALVRPHLVAIALALAVTWAAARRRWLLAFALGALYPFAYIGWPIAIGLAALAEASRLALRERIDLRAPGAVAAGCLVGLLLHPDFPDIARFAWLVHARILVDTAWGARAGFELGQEFQPYALADGLRHVLVPGLLACASAAVALRRRAAVALAFSLAALLFLALTLRTARFLEYLSPFAAVAAALAAGAAMLPRWVASVAVAGALAFTGAFGTAPIRALGTRGADVPPRFAEFFQRAIPEGAQVFTCEWGLTGELMLSLPGRRFLVALDPVLFWAKDPALYDVWFRLPREGGPGAAETIRRRFGARFVLCTADPRWAPLLRELTADRTVSRLVKSPLWFLYDLSPGAAAEPGPAGSHRPGEN